jgi:hypothetical protein
MSETIELKEVIINDLLRLIPEAVKTIEVVR